MSIAAHLASTFALPELIVQQYLHDLSDGDLLVRPHEKMNHIAWQLGHLISSENFHITQMYPEAMPPLPEGFAARHTKETAAENDRDAFCSKAEYLEAMRVQREGTMAVLRGLSDDQLLQPAPESIHYLGSTIGAVFAGESVHWMMHAGQWAVVRRKLGRPPLF